MFDIINKVRENPNIALNEIKDQLKRYPYNYLDLNQTVCIETRKILKLELSRERLVGNKLSSLYKGRNQKVVLTGIHCYQKLLRSISKLQWKMTVSIPFKLLNLYAHTKAISHSILMNPTLIKI